MTAADVLVDVRFWLFLFVFGTPMIAIEILVFRGWERIWDRLLSKVAGPK